MYFQSNYNYRKLLIISEVFYPEEFLINDIVLEWKRQNIELEILTKTPSYPFGKTYKGYKNKFYQITSEKGIKVHRVKIVEGYENSVFRKVSNYLVNAFIASIIALKIGKRFDSVFIYQTGPLTFALPGALIHKFYKKKTVIWSQDLWPDTVFSYGFKESKFNKKILNSFVRFIYKHMDVTMLTSRGFIESLKTTTKGKIKFEYVPQWPLVKANSKNLTLPKGWNNQKLHFTFTGNVGKVQNLDNVIEGFGLFSQKFEDKCQLNIIGDGSHLSSLKRKVKNKNIKNVVFYGRKPLGVMNSYYAASDVLVISLDDDPALNKYIPAKFQSYLTCGKPIFAIMQGEVKSLIENYNLGWVAPPGDVTAIAKTFKEIYQVATIELLNKGKNAQQLLETQFNRKKIIKKISSHLNV